MKLRQTFAFEVPLINVDTDSAEPEHACVVLELEEAQELYKALHERFGERAVPRARPRARVMEQLDVIPAEFDEDDEEDAPIRPTPGGRMMSAEEAAAWAQIQAAGLGQTSAGDVSMPAGWRGGGSGIGSRSV